MPGHASTKMSTRDEVQESLNNLRENIEKSKDPKAIRGYRALINQLLRRYGHLGVR